MLKTNDQYGTSIVTKLSPNRKLGTIAANILSYLLNTFLIWSIKIASQIQDTFYLFGARRLPPLRRRDESRHFFLTWLLKFCKIELLKRLALPYKKDMMMSMKSKLRAFGRQCRGVSLVGQGTEASQSVSVKDCWEAGLIKRTTPLRIRLST